MALVVPPAVHMVTASEKKQLIAILKRKQHMHANCHLYWQHCIGIVYM